MDLALFWVFKSHLKTLLPPPKLYNGNNKTSVDRERSPCAAYLCVVTTFVHCVSLCVRVCVGRSVSSSLHCCAVCAAGYYSYDVNSAVTDHSTLDGSLLEPIKTSLTVVNIGPNEFEWISNNPSVVSSPLINSPRAHVQSILSLIFEIYSS